MVPVLESQTRGRRLDAGLSLAGGPAHQLGELSAALIKFPDDVRHGSRLRGVLLGCLFGGCLGGRCYLAHKRHGGVPSEFIDLDNLELSLTR